MGCSRGSDLVWLGCRLVATAPIQLLAWELPYAAGSALKRQKKKRDKSDFSSLFRILRVYSTQKKRVAFNVSKMLSGVGAEGEV